MTDSNLEIDYYSVVGVDHKADSNEIRTAYRKASLKVHPDRNPNDPDAAQKFHALNTAFEILLDPIRRAQFDEKRTTKLARLARFAGLDNKRKALARDLEAREEAYRNQKDQDLDRLAKARKLDEIKAAGARMRQAKEAQLLSDQSSSIHQFNLSNPSSPQLQSKSTTQTSSNLQKEFDTLDCTLRFKWTRKKIPELVDSGSLSTRILSSGIISSSDIESIILSSKTNSSSADNPEGLTSKKGSAVVCFKSTSLCQRFLDFAQTDSNWLNCSVNRVRQS